MNPAYVTPSVFEHLSKFTDSARANIGRLATQKPIVPGEQVMPQVVAAEMEVAELEDNQPFERDGVWFYPEGSVTDVGQPKQEQREKEQAKQNKNWVTIKLDRRGGCYTFETRMDDVAFTGTLGAMSPANSKVELTIKHCQFKGTADPAIIILHPESQDAVVTGRVLNRGTILKVRYSKGWYAKLAGMYTSGFGAVNAEFCKGSYKGRFGMCIRLPESNAPVESKPEE